MIAGPDAIERLVEDSFTGSNVQCEATMQAKAYKDVVDSPERPIPKGLHAFDHAILDQGIARCEGMARIFRMCALPGISIANAHITQRLSSRPKRTLAESGSASKSPTNTTCWLVWLTFSSTNRAAATACNSRSCSKLNCQFGK